MLIRFNLVIFAILLLGICGGNSSPVSDEDEGNYWTRAQQEIENGLTKARTSLRDFWGRVRNGGKVKGQPLTSVEPSVTARHTSLASEDPPAIAYRFFDATSDENIFSPTEEAEPDLEDRSVFQVISDFFGSLFTDEDE